MFILYILLYIYLLYIVIYLSYLIYQYYISFGTHVYMIVSRVKLSSATLQQNLIIYLKPGFKLTFPLSADDCNIRLEKPELFKNLDDFWLVVYMNFFYKQVLWLGQTRD